MLLLKSKNKFEGQGSLHRNKRAKISLYEEPPTGDVSMEEFEQFALDRMRVLKAIDQGKAKGLKGTDLDKVIEDCVKIYLPFSDGKDFDDDLRKDHVSHFVLRMAYSKNEELRKWFLRQEEQLFKYRFSQLEAEQKNEIMSALNGKQSDKEKLKTLTPEEWDMWKDELLMMFGRVEVTMDRYKGASSLNNVDKPWTHLYKIPFEQVADLVGQRKCLLKRGDAIVISRDIITVVMGNYRAGLSKKLTDCSRAFHAKQEEESERLGPLLLNLTNAYLGADFSAGPATGRMTIDKLPTAMNRSAPLCMRNLYQRMTQSPHHLKHDGRMQFGLFLKGIGVTLEDSLAWWKQEWMRGGKTAEQVDKEYSYNIRHNYGVEGKRTNYTPYSCSKIINSSPVGDQHHGCPFRHWDESHLTSALQQMRINSKDIHDILEKTKGGHYQVACSKVFEATHGGAMMDSLNHPNQYFQDSWKFYEEKEGGSGTEGKEQQASKFAAPKTSPDKMEVDAKQ